jgi:hypothetical protein
VEDPLAHSGVRGDQLHLVIPHKDAVSWVTPGSTFLGVDGIGQHLSQSSIALICSAVCCYISGRREQLSRPCVRRLTLSLRQVLLEPAEPLAMEDHSRGTLSQQGTETQFSWFCTIETTSAPRPETTKTERVAVPRPADGKRQRAARDSQNLGTLERQVEHIMLGDPSMRRYSAGLGGLVAHLLAGSLKRYILVLRGRVRLSCFAVMMWVRSASADS